MSHRMPPLTNDQMDSDLLGMMQAALSREHMPNGVATLARRPGLIATWMPFMNYVRFDSAIDNVTVELIILRTQWQTGCEYEWSQHVRLAGEAGVSDETIMALTQPVTTEAWGDKTAAMLNAVDDLTATHTMSDEVYSSLQAAASEDEIVDLIVTVGNYTTVAMAMRGLGVALDERDVGFPTSNDVNDG